MTDVVLVPGAFQGGWYWDPILPHLRDAGHRPFPVTLPGLEADYTPDKPVNLETHIRFINDLLEEHDLADVALVGHSYGGMVITGAAARAPHRVSQLIYLDTPVPKDGDRVWDLIPTDARGHFVSASPDGYLVTPDPLLVEIDARSVPHPIASFLQPLDAPTDRLTMPRTFVVAGQGSAFQYVYDGLLNDPNWRCHSLDAGHDFVRQAPDAVINLLLDELQPAH